jgi:hypothetical protein
VTNGLSYGTTYDEDDDDDDDGDDYRIVIFPMLICFALGNKFGSFHFSCPFFLPLWEIAVRIKRCRFMNILQTRNNSQ